MYEDHFMPNKESFNVKIIQKSFNFLGCVFYGDPFHSHKGWSQENEIGLLWKRFIKLYNKYHSFFEKIQINDSIMYEVHIETEEFNETNSYYVFVGIEVDEIDQDMPIELFYKKIPKTHYAVVTIKGKDITTGGYKDIWGKWLPTSGYAESYPVLIEAYDKNRFTTLDDGNSEIDFYIPISRKINHEL
jgi:AraC family transcriptional regulator